VSLIVPSEERRLKMLSTAKVRAQRIRNQAIELINDAEAWNGFHPNEQPIETESLCVIRSMADKVVQAADRGDDKLATKLISEMANYVENTGDYNDGDDRTI